MSMQCHFAGVLQPSDAKRHITHTFAVAEHTTQLRIRLWHSEGNAAGLSNMLTLTVFDPRGFRGAGHRMGERRDGGRVHDVTLGASHATPGYIAGALPGGEWSVVIATHRITEAEPCAYRLDVAADCANDVAQKFEPAPGETIVHHPGEDSIHGARWYRGDLHAHTVHSDGRWDVPDLVAWARQSNLDFVTLSDHNTVSGLAQVDALSSPDLLTLGGQELTTFHGHALALGPRSWVDWRIGDGRSMPAIAREVQAAGSLFIIAHPMAIGDPICTGCSWTYADMMPGPARIVEIWNSPWDSPTSRNEATLALFYGWLNRGHRLVATAGTDNHGPHPADASPDAAADTRYGFNVVLAEARTERAILDAIRRGHLFLSSRPHVECEAHSTSGRRAMMGDVLPMSTDESAVLTLTWRGCVAGDHVRVIADGALCDESSPGASGAGSGQFDVAQARWVAIEIRDEAGHVVAITNPIFFTRE